MLANVASELTGFDPLLIADEWSLTMGKLAKADDMAEESPEFFLSGISLIGYLELDTTNSRLVESAGKLLEANLASSSTRTIRSHYSARTQEALHSASLLRFQSPEEIRENEDLWAQLGNLAITGIHLDSLIDARKDSLKLPQFTALQLTTGALTEMTKYARRINTQTWNSILRQSHNFGLDQYMVKKLIRPVLQSATN